MNTKTASRSRLAKTSTVAATGALLLASTLGAAVTAPADAAPAPVPHRVVHLDHSHDVVRFDFDTGHQTPEPRERATDITRTVVDYRAHRLSVAVNARALKRSGVRMMVAEIHNSDGRRYDLVVEYATKPIYKRVSLNRGNGHEVRCPGATWSLDRSSNRIAASVPVSCIGKAPWVRVGVGLVSAPSDLKTTRIDDSRIRGIRNDENLTLGPRQPRA